MNFRNSSKEHKGFLLSYFFWMFVSLTIVGASLGLGVYTARPVEQKIALSILSSVHDTAPPIVAKTVDELLIENANAPANLTPAQWKTIRVLMQEEISLAQEHRLVVEASRIRTVLMMNCSKFVYANFDKLPPETQELWKQFTNARPPSGHIDGLALDKVVYVQQDFVSLTLPVSTVSRVLGLCEFFEQEDDFVVQQSSCINKILPVLIEKGLKIDAGDPLNDVKSDLKAYILNRRVGSEEGVDPSTLHIPPARHSPITFDDRMLVDQLFQPQLSSGSTSQERAAH